MNKKKIYWLCQIFGWSFYGSLQLFLYATAQTPDMNHIVGEFLQVLFYIGSTHLLRFILISNGWLALQWLKLIPRIIFLVFLLSLFNYSFLLAFAAFTGELTSRDFMILPMTLNVFGPMIIYVLWSLIYLTFHYFERYNNSLKYEAAAKEIELKNLRSQLNPHFIFNALNSIRALVDEDPIKSKKAITQLSNILRNSLTVDRQRMVTFSEELATVKDYLQLEGIRYEERLQTALEIDPNSDEFLIPPLMIQTLVENGIKHGISTLRGGGMISIHTKVDHNKLLISIRNGGQITENNSMAPIGYGLSNTRKRLELIFGEEASFSIANEDKKTVLTQIVLPKTL
ncbi:MAG: histidine kinase [Cyclobacteriaceae bacterium]